VIYMSDNMQFAIYDYRTVPQGQHFINRRFQSTDKQPASIHKPCKGDTYLCVVPAGLGADVGTHYRKLKHTVNKILSLRDILICN
jgi:hypothetical protein